MDKEDGEDEEEEVLEARVIERLLLPPGQGGAGRGGNKRQHGQGKGGSGEGGGGDGEAQKLQKRAAEHAAAQVCWCLCV